MNIEHKHQYHKQESCDFCGLHAGRDVSTQEYVQIPRPLCGPRLFPQPGKSEHEDATSLDFQEAYSSTKCVASRWLVQEKKAVGGLSQRLEIGVLPLE